MTSPSEPGSARSKRRTVLMAASAVGLLAVIVGLVVFQPWKLFVDVTVDEADPFAAPAAASAPPTTAPPGGAPSTVAPGGATPSTAGAPPTTGAPAAPRITGGSFKSLAHPTRGEVRAGTTPQGTLVVYLENFETDNGPDLKVYVSRAAADGDAAPYTKDALFLGDLKGNVGNQVYEVPAGTDLSTYRSVVIWCEKFSVAFGAAPLGEAPPG